MRLVISFDAFVNRPNVSSIFGHLKLFNKCSKPHNWFGMFRFSPRSQRARHFCPSKQNMSRNATRLDVKTQEAWRNQGSRFPQTSAAVHDINQIADLIWFVLTVFFPLSIERQFPYSGFPLRHSNWTNFYTQWKHFSRCKSVNGAQQHKKKP